jgi:hypothetical protein
MSRPDPQRPVRRRRVFFIPGYDPVAPRAHRERYRREAARQADFSGHEIALSPGGPSDGYALAGRRADRGAGGRDDRGGAALGRYRARLDGAGVVAGYAELVSDGVDLPVERGALPADAAQEGAGDRGTLPGGGAFGGFGAGGGARRRGERGAGPLCHGARVPVSARFGVGWVLVASRRRCVRIAWAMLAGCGGAITLLAWYLMHDYAFSARPAAPIPTRRRRGWRVRRPDRGGAAEDVDEVLVVGHSSGAYLAVSVLADLIRAGRVPGDGPVLSLLTLGQVIPMVSFLPRAGRLRADLALMSETAQCELGRCDGARRWLRLRAVRSGCGVGRRRAGQTLATGPVGGLFQTLSGAWPPCDGGFSSGISSISTPSTTRRRSRRL